MSKQKKWSYPIWMQVGNDKLVTQLYQIGVYGIINNESQKQLTYHPDDLQNMHVQFSKKHNYEHGPIITVMQNERGFFEELIEETV